MFASDGFWITPSETFSYPPAVQDVMIFLMTSKGTDLSARIVTSRLAATVSVLIPSTLSCNSARRAVTGPTMDDPLARMSDTRATCWRAQGNPRAAAIGCFR